jgi:pimeloyl-ACP methyl ester carboxylesterase
MKKLMITTITISVVVYAGIAAFMYVAQRSFQYFPQASVAAGYEPVATYGLEGFEDVTIDTADGESLKAWYGVASKPAAPVIVYLHGNAGTLGERVERFRLFHREGYGVLAISWRGFGGSTGSPAEAGLMADGRGTISFLEGRSVPASQIVLFGESLGSGVAVQLAVDTATRPAAMVLDSPFTSTADMARLRYWFLPVGLLMKDQFRSDLIAPKVAVPVMVLHGTEDQVTPFRFGKALSEMFAGPAELLALEGAPHVADLTPKSWSAIKAFLQRHAAKSD